jgi:flagellar motility protein MotE (MotC chaperone)
MPLPRLLALAAVAAAGVLAIDMLENGPGVIGAARSFAEGVAAKAKHKSAARAETKDAAQGGAGQGAAAQAAPAQKDGAQKAASPLPPDASASGAPAVAVVAAKPAPICAESPAQLARDAGLSPAELQVIQSLGARRGELDAREQGLSTELALVQAAEVKVDARIAAMNALKGDMQGLLGQLDQKQADEVDRLVKVYEVMKPQAAAARFTLLSDSVRLPIASRMKERSLSAIIANMPPADARALTEALAARYVAQANAARQAISPTAAATAPAKTAAAAAPANGAPSVTAPAGPVAAAPVAHHRKVLHRAKPKAHLAQTKVAKPTPPTPPAKPAAAAPTTPAAPKAAATAPPGSSSATPKPG